MPIPRKAREAETDGRFDKIKSIFKKYDITLVEGSNRRFTDASNLFQMQVYLYDDTFSVSSSGSVVKRHTYTSYYYNTIDYAKLEQRIKRLLKKAEERQARDNRQKKRDEEINQKLINYLNSQYISYEVVHPYRMGSMKINIAGEEYYVGTNGTVRVNIAGKRMTLPIHNVAYIVSQAKSVAVGPYEDVAAQFQPKEEVASF